MVLIEEGWHVEDLWVVVTLVGGNQCQAHAKVAYHGWRSCVDDIACSKAIFHVHLSWCDTPSRCDYTDLRIMLDQGIGIKTLGASRARQAGLVIHLEKSLAEHLCSQARVAE